MKAEFEFNLSDPDENRAFEIYVQAMNMHSVLFEFDQWLRSEIKYADKDYQEVRDKLNEMLYDAKINIDL